MEDILDDSLRRELDSLPLPYTFDMVLDNGRPIWRAIPHFAENQLYPVRLDSSIYNSPTGYDVGSVVTDRGKKQSMLIWPSSGLSKKVEE